MAGWDQPLGPWGPESNGCVSVTGPVGERVVCVLPAVVGAIHCISELQITMYAATQRVALAAPTVVTTTNLPGSPAFTLPTAQDRGTRVVELVRPTRPLWALAPNTPTTVDCPMTPGVIWRVNVIYHMNPHTS